MVPRLRNLNSTYYQDMLGLRCSCQASGFTLQKAVSFFEICTKPSVAFKRPPAMPPASEPQAAPSQSHGMLKIGVWRTELWP